MTDPRLNDAEPTPSSELTGAYQPDPSTPVPVSKDARFASGQVLAGRYRIVSRLGKGGMGEVYRADDLRLGQSVALKFLAVSLLKDPRQLELLHEEVKLSRQISHPNVCRVYDIGEAEGQSFLSMEFIDGEDLASLLRRIGRLPADKGVEIARELCLGLAAAHDKGVIHRDLKPANIMLDRRGQVRITDFGLARVSAQVTGAEARSGTPAYMAPEQLAGKEATVRSDIYALGLMLYEVFTGKKAYSAATPAALAKLQESSAPTPSSHVADLDPAIERVILRCLEKDPRNRPPSALAVTAALPGGDPLAAALAAGELPSPEVVAAAGDAGVWPTGYAVACLLGTLAALVACVLLYRTGMLVGRVALAKSAGRLTEHAQEILNTQLKFPLANDSAIGFEHDKAYLRWIQKEDRTPNRWDRLAKRQPAALYFWYRQSPGRLVPSLFYPYSGTLEPGRIELREPAPIVPGMVSVKLDLEGRLLELHAVPKKSWSEQEPDWQVLFKAADLDPKRFTEIVPEQRPANFATRHMAWSGMSEHGDDLAITVEAAFYRGRPVYFQVLHERIVEEDDEAVGTQGMLDKYGSMFAAILEIIMLLAAAVLAPRNLYLGRADRQGALRLASWSFVLLLVVWAFETHHVLDIEDEFRLFTFGLAFALAWSAVLWLKYIALEPYVRRLWPESLITWTRLLAGQWRDPRLGRDLLLGTLVGVVLGVLDMLGRTLPAWCGAVTPVPYWDWWIPSTLIDGYWTGNFLINILYSFRWAFFDILLFLVLRALLRNVVAAVGAYALFSGALYASTSAGGFEPTWFWLFCALIQVLTISLLIRVGLFAMVTAIFAWYCVYFPLTTDLPRNGLFSIAAVVLLAAYGFVTSLGGRSLFGGDTPSQ